MFLLDHTKLKRGDIILSRQDDRTSELVRRMSRSDYSHARLYVGTRSSIDSDGMGVQAENIQRIPFDKETDVLVLRYYRELPNDENEARQKVEKYSDDIMQNIRIITCA